MKKNLAVRIGAIVMVLMVAFFSILPDLVSAEGDDADVLAESEIVAEEEIAEPEVPEISENAGETDLTESETGEGEEGQEGEISGGEVPETEITEPDTSEGGDSSLLDPSENGSADSEEKTTEPDVSEGEEPSPQEPNEGEDLTNPGEENPAQPAEEESGEMDTIDDYVAFLNKAQLNRLAFEADTNENRMGYIDLFSDDEKDFLLDETGTILIKYLGDLPYVSIPASVTVIGDSAFAGNSNLIGVILPASLQTIGNSAFNGCSNLADINIPDSVTSVGDSAFANCTGLAGASIGVGTGTISSNEFYNCISLQSVAVPEGISSVQAGAFANCSNLSSVSLPSTLARLDRGAFSGDVNLASISIAGGAYSSYDGCVYTGDGSQLLLCPQGKTGISIAPGTASIAAGAFNGCGYLLSAVVPGATSAIETNAFSGSAIKSVTIPTNVTDIGSQSGWMPDVVYGYTGSTAEAWANANNYVFESLNDTSTGGNGNIQDEHIEDPDDAPEPTEQTGGSKLNNVKRSSSAAGSGATAAISRNAANRTASTPKTGVEDYRIYFLCAAIFLMGIACFAYSRKLRLDR